MNADSFQNLIKKDSCQVFLFTCPGCVPLNFAVHPWFVINKFGTLSRWEVLFRESPHDRRWGHLYENYFPPFRGTEIIPWYEKFFWKGTLLGMVEGEPAEHMIALLEKSPEIYPYRDTYATLGPNSNTFAEWVLNQFPESGLELPWNAFGKNF